MMHHLQWVALAMLAWALPTQSLCQTAKVGVVRVPDGGIQPQVVVDQNANVHLIYYKGEPKQGDIFYVRSTDGGITFSSAKRVNSQPGSAIALATVRGAQISLGRAGRVHVAWNGSSKALPKAPLDPEMAADSVSNGLPMLYSRLNDAGTEFEPQRNLMTRTFALDGGGSVAADSKGNVYVAWHARTEDSAEDEEGRQVWVARSVDDGRSFSTESPASDPSTGACICCSVRALVANDGTLYIIYRAAYRLVQRHIYLLVSTDQGRTFRSSMLDKWTIGACPLSSMSLAQGPRSVLAAWERNDQVYYASVAPETLQLSPLVPAPASGPRRKYPVVATHPAGGTLLVWTEGPGMQKERALVWKVFDRDGQPTREEGRLAGVPEWSFAAAFARSSGQFMIVY